LLELHQCEDALELKMAELEGNQDSIIAIPVQRLAIRPHLDQLQHCVNPVGLTNFEMMPYAMYS